MSYGRMSYPAGSPASTNDSSPGKLVLTLGGRDDGMRVAENEKSFSGGRRGRGAGVPQKTALAPLKEVATKFRNSCAQELMSRQL
mmetsp:Transcript_8530/g.20633  ORF Transcript_8530/g.20633 Transcript_8530/m.20633 type:complete len:85 (-) Transcript_8530:112-366(-)